jgi:hypothetical protein
LMLPADSCNIHHLRLQMCWKLAEQSGCPHGWMGMEVHLGGCGQGRRKDKNLEYFADEPLQSCHAHTGSISCLLHVTAADLDMRNWVTDVLRRNCIWHFKWDIKECVPLWRQRYSHWRTNLVSSRRLLLGLHHTWRTRSTRTEHNCSQIHAQSVK